MPNAEVYHLNKHHQNMIVFEGDEYELKKVLSVLSEMTASCSERIRNNWEEWGKIKG